MSFPSDLTEKINQIVDKHETKRSSLIPVLREVQSHYGWLSNEAMENIAAVLDIPPSDVQTVATFYTMFFTKPKGKHVIWVCRTLSCALKGAEHVEHYLCDKLKLKTGQTSKDGKITLMEAECLASCGTAPVMLVDDTLYENLTRKKVDQIIDNLTKS